MTTFHRVDRQTYRLTSWAPVGTTKIFPAKIRFLMEYPVKYCTVLYLLYHHSEIVWFIATLMSILHKIWSVAFHSWSSKGCFLLFVHITLFDLLHNPFFNVKKWPIGIRSTQQKKTHITNIASWMENFHFNKIFSLWQLSELLQHWHYWASFLFCFLTFIYNHTNFIIVGRRGRISN